MAIWFQAITCSKYTESPAGHSSRHTGHSVKRKKHSTRRKKHPAFQCRKNTPGKGGKSETKVCCPLCKKMLAGDDGLLDHFGQSLCPKDQCTSTDLGGGKAEASSDGLSASSRRKDITQSTYKFSYRMEADMEKVN